MVSFNKFDSNVFPFKRTGGILLHPTSLPSPYGIGDLGPNLYRFLDLLRKNDLKLWQILPIGITGYGNSPYSSFSSYAGNPFIISPDKLIDEGLLSKDEVGEQKFSSEHVDYGKIIPYKWEILNLAFENFQTNSFKSLKHEFDEFKRVENYWLDNFAIFMSIKTAHNMKPWNEWDESLKFRKKTAIEQWKRNNDEKIEFQRFVQFLFFKQWNEIRKYAHKSKISIIGDIPIFVAYDSAEVWSNPSLFHLDKDRELLYVAGVPPDYFSKTGQRWGNPVYRWKVHRKRNFRWWISRIKHMYSMVDIIRIDHFRGFEAFWRIPASEPTAVNGEWVLGPGYIFFRRLWQKLGKIPIIAEDLGVITPPVKELLRKTGFPGMRVLQFAFGSNSNEYCENRFLPHNYQTNTIVYTGTHDNDCTKSWFEKAPPDVQEHVVEYTGSNGSDIVGDLIRLAWSSTALMSVIPLQDLLRLGSEGRMNFPGKEEGNWEWRFTWEMLKDTNGEELKRLSKLFGR
ncbi:MAG: 4-alpha-glucanotransferase [Candidatus Hodarchaeales archaeon]